MATLIKKTDDTVTYIYIKVESLVFGIMDGKNKIRRKGTQRWVDDMEDC